MQRSQPPKVKIVTKPTFCRYLVGPECTEFRLFAEHEDVVTIQNRQRLLIDPPTTAQESRVHSRAQQPVRPVPTFFESEFQRVFPDQIARLADPSSVFRYQQIPVQLYPKLCGELAEKGALGLLFLYRQRLEAMHQRHHLLHTGFASFFVSLLAFDEPVE